ncbi:hypothetical protein SDC9_20750 [bioreactor metagenome]|uniref:Uncharacterized protein n=2 Tax=root TaxID=1 RepID=A0A644U7L5_9ZZZZ|nr:hypothetical protein [Desulfitobacterium hafniense]
MTLMSLIPSRAPLKAEILEAAARVFLLFIVRYAKKQLGIALLVTDL